VYCPRCASEAVEGQRFCRNCGMNLGVILDAREGQRGPIDFESLKSDLRELGASLRSGFEEARQGIKRTQRFAPPAAPTPPAPPAPATAPVALGSEWVKPVRAAGTRRYSFQQATLGIIGGAASSGVLYYFCNEAANSGLVASIVNSILAVNPQLELTGVEPVFRTLWMFGLVGVAKGAAHLLNGIFFAPKPERVIVERRPPAPDPVPAPARYIPPDNSVTEDPTERFAEKTE
jgi:hypothetical protein